MIYILKILTCIPGIRKATSWYNTHISFSRPPVRGQARQALPTVVLLTDDVANRQKAEKEGIRCMSGTQTQHRSYKSVAIDTRIVRNYVEGMKEASTLLDLLSAVGQDSVEPTRATSARQALYPEVNFTVCSKTIIG